MSCNGCGKSFSLLNRERGCKKCGFAYCASCLKFKLELPDQDGKMSEKSVCASCHKEVTQPKSSKIIRPPPDALIRRLETLENPPPPNPITVYSTRLDRLKRGLSKEDAKIAERLEKLQSDHKSKGHGLPTDKEMELRLAKLKGEDEVQADHSSVIGPNPPKSEVKQTADLLAKIVDEVKLDQKLPNQDNELSDRLARLRGHEPVQTPPSVPDVEPEHFLAKFPKITNKKANTAIDIEQLLKEVSEESEADARQAIEAFEGDKDFQKQMDEWRKMSQSKKHSGKDQEDQESEEEEEDDSAATSKVIDQVLAEAKLEAEDPEMDESVPEPPSKSLIRQLQRAIRLSESDKDAEELPWCSICNEDANLRCHDCEGDLYCSRCFRECHQEDIDLRNHKVSDYKAPRKNSK